MRLRIVGGLVGTWRRQQSDAVGIVAVIVLALSLTVAAPGRAQAGYASIVMDAATGEVLHAVNADTRNYPASLTKMMTLYMVFEALDDGRLTLNARLPVSRRAQGMTPSKLGLEAGEGIRVEDAILALVTKSANDAAVVLAEALGGSEWRFALQMTETARELGMRRTRFRNASGLPNRGQLSTARDMARLGRALLNDFPQYYHYFAMQDFRYRGATYDNHNNLLGSYAGTDGIKTGYIRASGFNLVASVKRRGHRLIGVVFGGRTARSRDRHMVTLLDRAFAQLERRDVQVAVAPPPPKPPAITQAAAAPAASDAPPPVDPKPAAVIAAGAVDGVAGDWAVQVGAFRRFAPAHRAATRAAERVPEILMHTEVSISRVQGDLGPLYRARLVGLTESRARGACARLERKRVDCLVVKPVGGVEVALNNEGRVVPAN